MGWAVLSVPVPLEVGAGVGGRIAPVGPEVGAAEARGFAGMLSSAVVGAGVSSASAGAGGAGASGDSKRPSLPLAAIASSHVVKSVHPYWSSATHINSSASSELSVSQPTRLAVTQTSAYSSLHSSKSSPPTVRPASPRASRHASHSGFARQEKSSMGQEITLEKPCPTLAQNTPSMVTPKPI